MQVTAVTLNYVDEVFCVAGQVRFYEERFTSGKEGICSESVRNVGTSGAVVATTEGTRITVTSKSRRLGERLKATTGKC